MNQKVETIVSLILIFCRLSTSVNESTVSCSYEWNFSASCFTNNYGETWRDKLAILTPAASNGSVSECVGVYVGEVQKEDCPSGVRSEAIAPKTVCGHGDWFTCDNGRCIKAGLTCNGDDDCGDASDEYPALSNTTCTNYGNYICGIQVTTTTSNTPPKSDRYFLGIPGVEKFSVGFDILSGNFRGEVLSMRPFGSCRRVLKSGETDYYYRLPNNVNSFSQQYAIVEGAGDLTDSAGAAINETRKLLGDDNSYGGLLNEIDSNTGFTQSKRFLGYTLENIETNNQFAAVTSQMKVKISKISLKSPTYLELSDGFVQRLLNLPSGNMSYYAYRQLINEYGTHYVSSGTLGGEYGQTNLYDRCWLDDGYDLEYDNPEWREQLIFCDRENMRSKLNAQYSVSKDCLSKTSVNVQEKVFLTSVDILGGSVSAASTLKETLTSENWQAWVDTVTDYPALIMDDFKLERISRLLDNPIPQLSETERVGIQSLLDQAIDDYLMPYNAVDMCGEEYAENCRITCPYADDFDGADYTVRYIAGSSGSTYTCRCACDTEPYDVCGSVRKLYSPLTLLLCLLAATKYYW